jgi:hypothetical protein
MEKQKKEKSSNLKHVIPLNLSLVQSTDSRKRLPLSACDCDSHHTCDSDWCLYG